MTDYLINTPNRKGVRFDPVRFIAFRGDCFDPLNSYFLDAIKLLPVAGMYEVMDDANRPDMISAAIYQNDTQYWWPLLVYNDLWDITDVLLPYPKIPLGTMIRYFSIKDVEKLYFDLRARQVAQQRAT
jgi:hypothetical protein